MLQPLRIGLPALLRGGDPTLHRSNVEVPLTEELMPLDSAPLERHELENSNIEKHVPSKPSSSAHTFSRGSRLPLLGNRRSCGVVRWTPIPFSSLLEPLDSLESPPDFPCLPWGVKKVS